MQANKRPGEEKAEGAALKKVRGCDVGDNPSSVLIQEGPESDVSGSGEDDSEARKPQNVVGVIGKSLLYPTLEELGLALPMDIELAQKACVFRKAGFLKAGQAAKLIRKFQRLRLQPYTNNSDQDYDADGNAIHCTYYLNEGGLFGQKFGVLRSRVIALAQEANDVQKWGMDMSKVSVRVAEFHDYRKGGALPEKDHYDKGSLVTVDVMLEEAVEGGQFQTWGGEERGFDVHEFHVGDAIVFPSHKYHSVAPVRSGERRVMVVEVWSGEERVCGHRCELLEGECDFGDDA